MSNGCSYVRRPGCACWKSTRRTRHSSAAESRQSSGASLIERGNTPSVKAEPSDAAQLSIPVRRPCRADVVKQRRAHSPTSLSSVPSARPWLKAWSFGVLAEPLVALYYP